MTDATSSHRFATGDRTYLVSSAYADGAKLNPRRHLHERFGTAAVPWQRWVFDHLALAPELRVLDVGCGTGAFWVQNADAVPDGVDLVLSDLSQGILDEAAAAVEEAGIAATARVADVGDLPFAADGFDRVAALHMLYHAADVDLAANELARVCHPDGTVVVSANGVDHMAEIDDLLEEVFPSSPRDMTARRFGLENGAEILGRRFGAVEAVRYQDGILCDDASAVAAYALSMPAADDAGDDDRARVARECQALLERSGGAIAVTKSSGVFVCREPGS